MANFQKYGSMLAVVFLAASLLSNQAVAAELTQPEQQVESMAAAEEQPVIQQKTTGIVLLASDRYLQPAYLDIMSRYFVKCYSQYRYPMEYGKDMQVKCKEAMAKEKLSNLHNVTEKQLVDLVKDMDKEQVLFIHISDMVRQQRRRLDRWTGSENLWGASIILDVLLVDKNGIVCREKFYDDVNEKYGVDSALQEAYTDCIRSLQKKNIFRQRLPEGNTRSVI